ncbi:MAG: hypothetical protein KAI43_04910 [Candidatus Aureabacteria bacterium]|nr:hypothetical protein [Candidatus Auribacterota bacterium]
MKRIVFLCVLFCSILISEICYCDFIGVGRGDGLTSMLWSFQKDKVNSSFLIADKAEVFCVEKIGINRFIVGGVTENRGTIWILENGKIVHSEYLPEANVVYAIKKAKDGLVWVVGSHKFMGACAWVGSETGSFKISSILNKGSIAYGLCEGKNGEIFVGGLFYTHGKVWIYRNGSWNLGDILNDSRQINTLVADNEGTVYACGQKINQGGEAVSSGHGAKHQGGVWIFNGEQWGPGIDVPSSIDIYCSVLDNNGKVWLGGSGHNNRTAWVLEKPLWKPVSLENCLALYSMNVDRKTGAISTAGWNKSLRGRTWFKKEGKEWDKGYDLDKCFVIMGLVVGK